MAATRGKVLLISENLGTPSTYRPWHEYSVACLECLKEAGAEVTLVVERAFGFETGAKPGALNDRARLMALRGYLSGGEFDKRLVYRGEVSRFLAVHAPAVLRIFADRLHARSMATETSFANDPDCSGGSSPNYIRPAMVDRFLYPRRFYSSANLRAVYGTGIAEMDASGHELVIIDGLLPIRVKGMRSDRVLTIVHSLNSATEPKSLVKERLIVRQALLEMARRDGVIFYATEDVRLKAEVLAARLSPRASTVLGPLASNRIQSLSGQGTTEMPARFVASLNASLRRSRFIRSAALKNVKEKLILDLANRLSSTSIRNQSASEPPRPTLVLVWSGGPKSDVSPILAIATDIADFADLVVLGVDKKMLSKSREAHTGSADLPVNLIDAGNVSEPDRIELFRHAALAIYPDRSGAGPKVLEAAVLRTPVLCFDLPENREFVGDSAAFFVPASEQLITRGLSKILAGLGVRSVLGAAVGSGTPPTRSSRVTNAFAALLERVPAAGSGEGRG